jgi:hypothetical protein
MVKVLKDERVWFLKRLGTKTTKEFLERKKMGSVTNLKENKTLFIPCSCKSEILVIEYDHEIQLADLAIFEHYTNYSHKMSLWQRLRYCFKVLFEKKPYSDQMVLDNKQLKDLQKFLNELNL